MREVGIGAWKARDWNFGKLREQMKKKILKIKRDKQKQNFIGDRVFSRR